MKIFLAAMSVYNLQRHFFFWTDFVLLLQTSAIIPPAIVPPAFILTKIRTGLGMRFGFMLKVGPLALVLLLGPRPKLEFRIVWDILTMEQWSPSICRT